MKTKRMGFYDNYPHLDNSMMNYDTLIGAIEKLEADKIISFEEFKQLPIYEIRKQFFSKPHPTMLRKAIIKIEDKRAGKTGPSEYTTVTEYIEEGKVVKRVVNTQHF